MSSVNPLFPRLLICESEEVVSRGLESLLRDLFPGTVVDILADADELLVQDFAIQPDIILLGYSAGVSHRLKLPKQVRLRMPGTRILTLLGAADEFWEALLSESDGYALREMSAAELERAVFWLSQGHCFLGSSISDYLIKGPGWNMLQSTMRRSQAKDTGLSARESEVLKLIAEGKPNNEIAVRLGLSLQTVKVHVKHILRKLNVPDRTNAAISYMGGATSAKRKPLGREGVPADSVRPFKR